MLMMEEFWLQNSLLTGGIGIFGCSQNTNGHIYALLGIWDLYRVTNDFNVKQSFEKRFGNQEKYK